MLSLVIILLLIFVPTIFASGDAKINIVINNQVVGLPEGEQEPFLSDSRTYVPLRVISENLGANVEWDKESQQVLIRTGFDVYDVPINPGQNLRIVLNGEVFLIQENLGRAFITAKGRTVVPLRAVAQALDCEVEWVENLVIINKKEEAKIGIATNFDREDLLDLTIMGEPLFTGEQLRAFLAVEEERIKNNRLNTGENFLPFPDLVDYYLDLGREYGIRGDIALFQALKETGYFQFTGDVRHYQNNYCGLWATGVPLTGKESHNGSDPTKVFFLANHHGATFLSSKIGVEAQIQHLYAYATDQPLPDGKVLYSPRFVLVEKAGNRASAPKWINLTGKWATDPFYGVSLLNDYVGRFLNFNEIF